MASTINADDGVVSGSAGVKTSADNSGVLELQSSGTTQFTLGSSSVVINEAGADVDFRVEGDTDANLLFVDASADFVGIGTNSPAVKLDVAGRAQFVNSGFNYVLVDSTVSDSYVRLAAAGTVKWYFRNNTANTDALEITPDAGSTTGLFLTQSGNLGLGVTPSAWETTSSSTAFQFNGSYLYGYRDVGLYTGNNAYYDGAWKYYASSRASTRYDMANGTFAWNIAPSGTAGTPISFTQAMTLTAAGNLWVGTTSSYAKFHVKATSAADVIYRLEPYTNSYESKLLVSSTSSGDGGIRYGTGGGNNLDIFSYGDMRFYCGTANISGTVGDERARIPQAGGFLIGTTNSSVTSGTGFKFDPNGLATGVPLMGIVGDSGSNTLVTYRLYSTTAAAYRFYVGYGGQVYATNTTISSTSDVRLKENIRDLDVGLDAVMALKPRKFDWKPGKGRDKKDDRGFIAQELEQVFPDLIDDWLDPAPEGEEPYKSVRQDLIPVLVKAIQEQQTMIEDLKAKVAALESK